MTALAPSAIDQIRSHVPCLGCGYDLFASNKDGRCPECGKDVGPSLEQGSVLLDPANAVHARASVALTLTSSIFAGLCPAACFAALNFETALGPLLMTIAFGCCAVNAGLGEYRRRSIRMGTGTLKAGAFKADLVAAAGLLMVNLGGYLYVLEQQGSFARGDGARAFVAGVLAIGFCALCASAWRAVPTWRAHAELAAFARGRKLAKFLKFMGWTKAIYETLWLACCWISLGMFAIGSREWEDPAIFFAIGAFFGLFGFAVIWMLMIITHAILLVQIRKATARR